jgi:O-methyltransferase involved in polyketide biosynthesis
MYLSDSALQTTLGAVARLSAPGSTLAIHYHDTSREAGRRERFVRKALLSLWNEPQIGLRSPMAMHQAAERGGFRVVNDSRPADWARVLGAAEPEGHTAEITHLLVAIPASHPAGL